jgi:hypothetical protein
VTLFCLSLFYLVFLSFIFYFWLLASGKDVFTLVCRQILPGDIVKVWLLPQTTKKKFAFAKKHHKSLLICYKTLNPLFYLILIDIYSGGARNYAYGGPVEEFQNIKNECSLFI